MLHVRSERPEPVGARRFLNPGIGQRRHGLRSSGGYVVRDRQRIPVELAQLIVHFGGAGPAEAVVELVEQHPLPCRCQFLVHVQRLACRQSRQRRQPLGFDEGSFGPGVERFHPAHHAVTTDGVHVQVAFYSFQRHRARAESDIEVMGRGREHYRARIALLQGAQFLYRRPRGAAAMVSHPEEEHQRPFLCFRALDKRSSPFPHHVRLSTVGLLARCISYRDPIGRELRAVNSAPVEQRYGNITLVLLWPHHYVGAEATFAQQLRQRTGVAEGIDVVTDGSGCPKSVLKVTLAVQQLAANGLARWQVTVGLDPLSAHDVPSPSTHVFFDPLEQCRVHLLGPHIISSRTGSEKNVLAVVQPVGSGSKSGHHLSHALTPIPDPDRVDMRVTYCKYRGARLRLHGHATPYKPKSSPVGTNQSHQSPSLVVTRKGA